MKNQIHSHYYEGLTNVVENHLHKYSGQTTREPDYPGHTHYMSGYVTVEDQHTHYYSFVTSPEIPYANGHIHYYVGWTTLDHRHYHYIWGYTSVDDHCKKAKKHFTMEEARNIGNLLNVEWSLYDVAQFRDGLDIELEHGRHNLFTNITNDDPVITGKIALAHLNEFPDYYIRLKKMEEDAEAYWEKHGGESGQDTEDEHDTKDGHDTED